MKRRQTVNYVPETLYCLTAPPLPLHRPSIVNTSVESRLWHLLQSYKRHCTTASVVEGLSFNLKFDTYNLHTKHGRSGWMVESPFISNCPSNIVQQPRPPSSKNPPLWLAFSFLPLNSVPSTFPSYLLPSWASPFSFPLPLLLQRFLPASSSPCSPPPPLPLTALPLAVGRASKRVGGLSGLGWPTTFLRTAGRGHADSTQTEHFLEIAVMW